MCQVWLPTGLLKMHAKAPQMRPWAQPPPNRAIRLVESLCVIIPSHHPEPLLAGAPPDSKSGPYCDHCIDLM